MDERKKGESVLPLLPVCDPPLGSVHGLVFAVVKENKRLLGVLFYISSRSYLSKTDFSTVLAWAVLFWLLHWLMLIPEMPKLWGLCRAALPAFLCDALSVQEPSKLID